MTIRTSALIAELKSNNFAPACALASVIQKLCNDPDSLDLLLSTDAIEIERLLAAKHDGGNRPAWHPSPSQLNDWARYYEPLVEAYVEHAAMHDRSRVFWRILNPESHAPYIVDSQLCWKWRKEAIIRASQDFGPWVAAIDLRHFFRDVNAQQIYDILGPNGLALDPALVDSICAFVARYELGLPQTSLISDIIARLLLTPFDNLMHSFGFRSIRWQDDILLFGATTDEAQAALNFACSFLEDEFKFNVNRAKVSIEPPSRIDWVAQGINWGSIPVESYQLNPSAELEEVAATYGQTSSQFRRTRSPLDCRTLFLGEYTSNGAFRCEPGFRHASRTVGQEHPELIIECASGIVAEHPSAGPALIRCVAEHSDISSSVFSALPSRASFEQDCLHAIEASSENQICRMARTMIEFGAIEHRSTRQALIELLPRTPDGVAIALTLNSSLPWVDESAARALMILACTHFEEGERQRLLSNGSRVVHEIAEIMR